MEKLLFSEPTNSITYIGTESGYQRVMSILATLDIADRQYITKVIQFKYVSVYDLSKSTLFNNIVKLPGFGVKGMDRQMLRMLRNLM